MKTILIPNDGIRALRETIARDVHAQEHDAFTVLHGETAAVLPISQLQLPECKHQNCRECRRKNLRSLISAVDASVKRIRDMYRDMEELFQAIAEAHVWTGIGDTKGILRAEKFAEVRKSLPLGHAEVPDVAYAELMARPEAQILEIFRDTLSQGAARVTEHLRECLREMQRQRVAGEMAWFGTDAGAYTFYRVRRVERQVDETRNIETERTETRETGEWSEFEVTHRTRQFKVSDLFEKHEHQLFNAARYQYPARQIRKPAFIERFLLKVPQWLRPHVFIVEGDMLRETIEETQAPVRERTETEEVSRQLVRIGRLYSPAVTIADFVLTGWSGSDLGR